MRRITAVTGAPARAAHELGATLEAEIVQAMGMSGKEQANVAKELNLKVDKAAIPAVKKAQLKDELKKLQSRVGWF